LWWGSRFGERSAGDFEAVGGGRPVRKTGKLASVVMNSFMALDRATATKWQAQFGGEGKPN
jgi:hypothetical protein